MQSHVPKIYFIICSLLVEFDFQQIVVATFLNYLFNNNCFIPFNFYANPKFMLTM